MRKVKNILSIFIIAVGALFLTILVKNLIGELARTFGEIGLTMAFNGNDYYVDMSAGNDSNDGSQGSPWATIGQAVSIAQGGDTVYVADGHYQESIRTVRSGEPGSPISFIASGENVFISPADDLDDSAFVKTPGYNYVYQLDGWSQGELRQTYFPDIVVDDPDNDSYYVMKDSDGPIALTEIKEEDLSDNGYTSALEAVDAVEGSYYLDGVNSILYVHPYGDRTPGNESTDLWSDWGELAFYIKHSYIVLDGFKFFYASSGSGAVQLNSSSTNCELRNLYFSAGTLLVYGEDHLIYNLKSTHNNYRRSRNDYDWYTYNSGTGAGIRGKNITVQGGEMWHNWNNFSTSDSENLTVDGLALHGAPNHNWLPQTTKGLTIKNVIEYNAQDGIFLDSVEDAVIDGMTSFSGIYFERDSSSAIGIGPVVVRNSILMGGTAHRQSGSYRVPSDFEAGVTFENNIFLKSGALFSHFADGSGSARYDLAEYIQHSIDYPDEPHATMINNTQIDSGFELVLVGGAWIAETDYWDVHITDTNSPAYNAGSSHSITSTDFEGDVRPAAGAYDIGADEYTKLEDTAPPFTSGHNPAKGATDVPLDTNISLHVEDSGVGVDQATIALTVEGTPVTPAVISGTPEDYTLTYDPPVDFGYAQVVEVTVDAADLAGNAMEQEAYSFTTVPDTTPPVISAVTASASTTSAVITWATDEPSSSQVEYREIGSGDYLQSELDTDPVTSHRVTLTELNPATDYEYHVISIDANGNESISSPDNGFTTTNYTYTYLEAENGALTSPIQIGTDTNASGGEYIYAPEGTGNTTSPEAEATYDITISEAGDYHLWLLMYGPAGDNDALYIGFDGSYDRVYPTQWTNYEWVQVEVTHRSGDYLHSLTVGSHQINISHGEELARADEILLTNDLSFVPTWTPNDTTPPTNLSLIINSGKTSTNSTSVVLALSASDNTAVVWMRFSNDNISWTAEEDYLTTKDWNILSGDGAKTVYVQFADEAGNWSDITSDTINLDTTPPAINDLSADDITDSSAVISFSSTEEATAVINYGPTANYGLSKDVSADLSVAHTVNLTDLSDNTVYHYQLTVTDNLGNYAITIDYTFATKQATVIDTVSPSAITDLDINNIGAASLTLSWSAPGDDENEGIANSYNLRYDAAEITDSNFDQADELAGLPFPQTAGTLQSYDVIGLSPSSLYYFAIKTVDEAGNISNLSNVVYAITNDISSTADTTPPLAITDLKASEITQSSALLSWTATGDDDNNGAASSYDVRYLENKTITEQNWISATQITIGEPTPAEAGADQVMSVNSTNADLNPDTVYYFAIKTFDEVPNISELSNVISFTTLSEPDVADTSPPDAIIDLAAVYSTKDSVTLSWTSSGDDGKSGTAISYDIRYLTDDITENNWNQATQISNEPIPEISGAEQEATVSGLNPDTVYYFAIKAIDEAGNASDLSNIAHLKTSAGEIVSSSGGGGGGGGGGSGYYDTSPPKNVEQFTARGASGQILLTWQNPTDSDFIRTIIVRKENDAPADRDDGETIYQGTAHKYTDIGLKDNTTYYYAAYAIDRSGNYSNVIVVSAATNNQTDFSTDKSGEDKTDKKESRSILPDRALVKTENDSRVYIISGQSKRWIPTAEVFQLSDYRWSDIQIVDQEELDQYFDNMLVKTEDNPKIYLITTNGRKRWLPNEESFYSYDFSWDQVETISKTELDAYAVNDQVKTSENDDVYYIYLGLYKKRYPNKEIFYSYGHQDKDIAEISRIELNSYRQIRYIKVQDYPTLYWLDQRRSVIYPVNRSFENLNENGIDALEINSTEMKYYALDTINKPLPQKLAGRILLQVESEGKAWYVNPINCQRYYLGRPRDAFKIMKEQALGVKHGFIADTDDFPDRLLGRILLDVDQNGETYYISPVDRRKYYLGRPRDAFKIMKEQALGVSDADLNEIEESS